MALIDIPDGEGEEYRRMGVLSPTISMAASKFSHACREHADIPVRLRELMRMRVAQINHCNI